MTTFWREYGLIAVLLVVAIGGYLWLSKSEEDIVTLAMAQVADHLVSLVPEEAGKQQARQELDRLSERVASREVTPDQLETLAASILNLQASGARLDGNDATLVVQAATGGGDQLPSLPEASQLETPASATASSADGDSGAPLRVAAGSGASRADLAAAARRIGAMVRVYESVARVAPPDSTVKYVAPVQFEVEGGLRAFLDDRLKSRMDRSPELESVLKERVVEWRPRLAEEITSQRQLVEMETETLRRLGELNPDSLVDGRLSWRSLETLMQLESQGLIFQPQMDSLTDRLMREIEVKVLREQQATAASAPRPASSQQF